MDLMVTSDDGAVHAARVFPCAGRDDFGYREILELDIPAAIARLRKVLGARPLYVVGHSLGGQLALFSAARLLPWYPGTRLGIGCDQPRRLMRDWGRVTREGRYAPEGSGFDYEGAARALALPVLSIGIGEDPIAPASARDALLARVPRSAVTRVEIDGILEHTPWKRHFSWARRPQEASSAIGGWLGARPGLRSAA